MENHAEGKEGRSAALNRAKRGTLDAVVQGLASRGKMPAVMVGSIGRETTGNRTTGRERAIPASPRKTPRAAANEGANRLSLIEHCGPRQGFSGPPKMGCAR